VSLEALTQSLNSCGWRLGSLCQLEEGWYACLIDDEGFTHTATGQSAIEAIATATERQSSGRLYDRDRAALEAEEINTPIDLAALGLVRRKEPIKRRF
jgi:hypothetical protein